MGICMDESSREDLVSECFEEFRVNVFDVDFLCFEPFNVADFASVVDELSCQYARSRQLSMHFWNVNVFQMLQVICTTLCIVSFVNKVQLIFEAPSQIADDPTEVVVFMNKSYHVLQKENRANVTMKSLLKINVLDFYRNIISFFRLRSEHLRKRRSCDRLIVKFRKNIVGCIAKVLLEKSINFTLLPFQTFIFQQFQCVGVFNRKNVINCRESLSNLDI